MFRRVNVIGQPDHTLTKRRNLLSRRGTVNEFGPSLTGRVSGSEQAGSITHRDPCRERRQTITQMDNVKGETSGISIMVQRRPSADSVSSIESLDYNDNKTKTKRPVARESSLQYEHAVPDLLIGTDARKRRASEQLLAAANLSDDIRTLDQMFRMMRALQQKEDRVKSPSPLSSYEQIIVRRQSVGQVRIVPFSKWQFLK